jgi:hypothetical protein
MILNDTLFVKYGGQLDQTTIVTREVAYEVAQEQVEEYLGYPLIKIQVTGEYPANRLGDRIALKHSMVSSLDYTALVSLTGEHAVQEEITNAVFLIDNERGIIDTALLRCWKVYPGYALRVVYTTGLETGTFNDDRRAMFALSMAAQLILNELSVPGLTEVRVGVQEYSNMKYSEKRFPLNESIFGSSSGANYIRSLLKGMNRPRVGRV